MAAKDFAVSQPLIRAPPMRPAPIRRTAPDAGGVMTALCLSGAFQDGGGHGLLGRFPAPEHKLECRVIVLAGFNGEVQKRLALGGADPGIREDQNMPEEHRAVL